MANGISTMEDLTAKLEEIVEGNRIFTDPGFLAGTRHRGRPRHRRECIAGMEEPPVSKIAARTRTVVFSVSLVGFALCWSTLYRAASISGGCVNRIPQDEWTRLALTTGLLLPAGVSAITLPGRGRAKGLVFAMELVLILVLWIAWRSRFGGWG